MRLVIPRKVLLAAVSRCRGATDPKAPLPALACVLLTAETAALGGTLRVAGTDLYRATRTHAPADVASAGSVALPAADLEQRVKAMPEGPVELSDDAGEAGANAVTLRAVGKPRRYTLTGLPGGEYPALPTVAGEQLFTVGAETLAGLLARVVASASDDATRSHVNGALCQWGADRLRMVSTDGHRLTMADAAMPGDTEGAAMLPKPFLVDLRRLLDGAEGTVSVSRDDGWIHCRIGDVDVSTKTAARPEDFPPYQQVIPAVESETTCVVNRAALADAVSAVRAAADKGGVALRFSAGSLKLAAETAAGGSGFDEIAAEYTGPVFSVGSNPQYILDALSGVDSDTVTLGVTPGDLNPFTFRGDGYTAVVMPLRM